jgi:alkylation response protein AidB-like acyl-CoA dehydrogenase
LEIKVANSGVFWHPRGRKSVYARSGPQLAINSSPKASELSAAEGRDGILTRVSAAAQRPDTGRGRVIRVRIMDFELTEEQNKLQQSAIEFARTALADSLIDRDARGVFDHEGWKKCAGFGVLGLPVPESYGGLGLGLTEVLAVMEGLGYATRDQGLLFSLNAHLWTNTIPILRFGTEAQKSRYLRGLCDGSLIGANAASEPNAGSDIFSMTTRARRKGDCYRLTGAKMFVTNAPVANLFVAYATIDPALGPMGITAFIIERDRPGLTVSGPLHKMGLRTSPMAEVIFDNCEVPVENRLGREGRGVDVFECSMEWERGSILASCLGGMRRQLEDCVHHARSRKQFGQPIGKYQSVANRIVDMKVRLETARPLVYKIGWLKQQDRDATMEAAIAKLYVSECYVKSALDAIQTFGGYGYMTEQEVERDLRDAVGSTIYSGTTEIQRTLIARRLGL